MPNCHVTRAELAFRPHAKRGLVSTAKRDFTAWSLTSSRRFDRWGSTDGDVNSALRKTLVKLAKGSLMVYWCLLISIDVYWCLLMFIDVYWYLLMFIDVCWCLLMFIDIYWCLLMFVDVYWCLLMFIDVCWCLPEIGRFTIIYSIVVHRKLSARYLSWNLVFGQGFCSDWWMSLGRIVLHDVTTTSM